jgi:hypothetical protein
MRWKVLCLVPVSALVLSGALVSAALAETKGSSVSGPVKKPPPARTRVTVQQRSFLDAGTEVKPGQLRSMDYAFPPGYSPTAVIDYTSANIYGPHGGLLNPYGFGPW